MRIALNTRRFICYYFFLIFFLNGPVVFHRNSRTIICYNVIIHVVILIRRLSLSFSRLTGSCTNGINGLTTMTSHSGVGKSVRRSDSWLRKLHRENHKAGKTSFSHPGRRSTHPTSNNITLSRSRRIEDESIRSSGSVRGRGSIVRYTSYESRHWRHVMTTTWNVNKQTAKCNVHSARIVKRDRGV